MRLIVADTEVFLYDWLFIGQDRETMEFAIFHNEPEALCEYMSQDAVFVFFNGKHYDQFIVKAICTGATNEEIKDLSDYLVAGGQGWEHPIIQNTRFWFNVCDIKDDMQMGLSLKAIEGHLGMNVQESTVDFTLDRPLTQAELDETIRYCRHDVETTMKLVDVRKSYLTTKMNIGRMVGIPDVKALSMTNAKLTAAFLKANRPAEPWTDERQYQYPENLRREYIPDEVIQFFDRMYDPKIPDDDLFKGKIKLAVGDCPVTIGYGGIHGAVPNFIWKEDTSS